MNETDMSIEARVNRHLDNLRKLVTPRGLFLASDQASWVTGQIVNDTSIGIRPFLRWVISC